MSIRPVRLVPPVAAFEPPPVSVVDDLGDAPAPGELLCLVSPLPASVSLPALAAGGRRAGREVVEVSVPGIGARYLGGVARSAAATGWGLPELAALVVELEHRCTYWVAASTLAPLGGVGGRMFGFGRGRAMHWSHRGWTATAVNGRELDALARGAGARRAVCACRRSGAPVPRGISRALDQLSRSGIAVGRVRAGLASQLGAGWAVEGLAAPRVSASQLVKLREQFTSAPRCGWCGIPVVGSHCRRCTPGAPA